MQENNLLFPEDIYSEHLATIDGIHFTRREIDVIACLLNARGTSKIALLLSIALRTVVSHIRNIMLKLECNSREGIIDFIERSHKLPLLREHYSCLVTEVAFKKSLKEISKLKRDENSGRLIVYWEDQKLKNALLHCLNNHLNQAGIKAEVREQGFYQKTEVIESADYALLLLIEKKDHQDISRELAKFDSIDLSKHKNYYISIFEILKKLLPKVNLGDIVTNFRKHTEGLKSSSEGGKPKAHREEKEVDKHKNRIFHEATQVLKNRKWYFISAFLVLGVVSVGFLGFKIRNEPAYNPSSIHNENKEKREESSIRSDLILPTESALLRRPEIITQLDENFKGGTGIQTIALVGPGGTGKTTLARQYAHQQKVPVVWEINADTQEGLRSSFESLASALAKTEEDKKDLKGIQVIKNPEEKEEKIIQFVKKCLRINSNWFLIFDNVEKFTDIQRYFPQDNATWGEGRIILTTRDVNIQNNKKINNVIQIGELHADQKLDLFIKIMSQGNKQSDTPVQTEEVKAFLENIPPFPLDVSVAAYYLKATNAPYTAYLENLTKHNKEFESVQENLLKEAGDYTKTRYGIITLSLQQIINTHKDFADLLLFISLIDSQHIPRDLLDKYKDKAVVDNFLYTLKKYSLITNESSDSHFLPTLSIHRSTQAIALAYLVKLLNLEKNKHFIEHVGTTFKNYAAEVIDKEDFPKMNLLIRHCEMFLSHTKLLTDFVIASISTELGDVYMNLGNHEKAKQLLEQSIIIYRKNSYKNHPWLARALGCLGDVYRELPNFEKAKQLLEESLVIYRKNSYENHPWFAWTLVRLGIVYSELGNSEKAKQLFEKCLVIYRKNSFENHPAFARTLVRIGIVYRELGNYEKAKQLFEQSIVIYRKNSYENHPWFAWALGCLGTVYRELGNYEKAKQFFEQTIVIYRKNSCENHPWFARALAWLGIVYRDQGNYEKAKQFLEESLVIYRKNSFENNPWFAWALGCLGTVYRELGNYEKAKQLFEKCIKIYRNNSLENHPWFALALGRLGNVYRDLGNYEKAKQLLEESLVIYRKNSFENNPWFARALGRLGNVYRDLDNYEKAKQLLEEGIVIYRKNSFENHPWFAWTLENLGNVYRELGNYEKAKDLL